VQSPSKEDGTMNKVKVLFLAANPEDTRKLKLDEEIREITEKMRRSNPRLFELVSAWALRSDDLLQALNEYKPHIVHFSGHGNSEGEILVVGNSKGSKAGVSKSVSQDAILGLFTTLKGNIRVVVFNFCESKSLAQAVTNVIDCAIGTNNTISDLGAITFAASFYRAIGFGCSIQQAFDQGKAALTLEGIKEADTYELIAKVGIDPSQIFLVSDQEEPSPALRFTTEKVIGSPGGFTWQFSISNAAKHGQLNVFQIAPVLLCSHYFKVCYRTQPRELPTVMMQDLNAMARSCPGTLQQIGNGIFGMELLDGDAYRLSPGEIETFKCPFVVDMKSETLSIVGMKIDVSDFSGARFTYPSDCVLAIDTWNGPRLAKFDLRTIQQKLANIETMKFEDQVIGDGIINPTGFKSFPLSGRKVDWQDVLQVSLNFLTRKSQERQSNNF
jgi:hypothetical protein